VILCVSHAATDSYAPTEMPSSSRSGGGVGSRTPSARRTESMTSSVAERSNTLPRTAGHVPTSPLPAHRQSSASNTPPSVSPKQSPTWRRKTFNSEREVGDKNEGLCPVHNGDSRRKIAITLNNHRSVGLMGYVVVPLLINPSPMIR